MESTEVSFDHFRRLLWLTGWKDMMNSSKDSIVVGHGGLGPPHEKKTVEYEWPSD